MPKIIKHRITVTLPAEMFDALAASGAENDRKLEQEIRFRLRKSFEDGSSLASWERTEAAE